MRGMSCSMASRAVAPESPNARQTIGRRVRRPSARAVTAATVSSLRGTPIPDTDDSPIASRRLVFLHQLLGLDAEPSAEARSVRDGVLMRPGPWLSAKGRLILLLRQLKPFVALRGEVMRSQNLIWLKETSPAA